jgi:hypothetical protein
MVNIVHRTVKHDKLNNTPFGVFTIWLRSALIGAHDYTSRTTQKNLVCPHRPRRTVDPGASRKEVAAAAERHRDRAEVFWREGCHIEEAYWPAGPRGWLESGEVPLAPGANRLQGGDVIQWDKPEDLPPDEDRVWVDRWDYACSAGDGTIQWDVRQKSALPFTRAFFQSIGSKPENCKLLITRGDSMEPFLFNRDTIMVDISKTQIRDGAVYAICFENEALVKRIYKQAGGVLVLNSYNSANYPDKTVDPAKASQFEVIGEVVYRSGAGFADG